MAKGAVTAVGHRPLSPPLVTPAGAFLARRPRLRGQAQRSGSEVEFVRGQVEGEAGFADDGLFVLVEVSVGSADDDA
ncbi:hypothetical protein QR77_02090, partial [Streptomyces sp. 150FB]